MLAKDHDLKQAVKDYEAQFVQITQTLAEFKHRALTAEVILISSISQDSFSISSQLALEESSNKSSRTQELEKEVKEKNLLIGKLRHEGGSSPCSFTDVHAQRIYRGNLERTSHGSSSPAPSLLIRYQCRP